MEVAGQWRREWAGTAEYGKVTEGGVTRRVARAMEVLHASAPGTRVRVMRAAYHSTAGPGSSSYLMHSSRKVLSSGYNFLEPSSLPSQPLEISSTPLDASADSEIEREEYKVTEPDDYEISEPSKWRSSIRNNSTRMPSEESSSADNASIIDLDSRASSRSTLRRKSNEKEDTHRIHTINTRVSPLLDAPVALSTLKYTSILNGSEDWNTRRKSYSFEDTSPVDISSSNNLFTKDSSTDSGICKSSEIVNDYSSTIANSKYANNVARMAYIQEETFKDWLSKNRSNSYKRSISPKSREEPKESKAGEDKITLESSGKVTITLPLNNYNNDKESEILRASEEYDRKTKKVEFCKTELHFAVDTGTVNIIATDEKPPPSTDFRKRRSAFVPLNEKIERPITLFGEKTDAININSMHSIPSSGLGESDENTAATKSILKNKIPKPKPYLLGENMVFGESQDSINHSEITNNNISATTLSAVSLINKQLFLEREPRHKVETIYESYPTSITNKPLRTRNTGPQLYNYKQKEEVSHTEGILNKTRVQTCDVQNPVTASSHNKPKMRELRCSDLAYFGIEDNIEPKNIFSQDNLQEEILQSVKLVQQVSNSVCNSEAESDDTPEYQNLSKYNLNITPTPKPRSKYVDNIVKANEPRILKPIVEQDSEKAVHIHRINLASKREETLRQPRKISESPKTCTKSITANVKTKTYGDFPSTGRNASIKKLNSNKENEVTSSGQVAERNRKTPESPLYINLNKVKVDRAPTSNISLQKNAGPKVTPKSETTPSSKRNAQTYKQNEFEQKRVTKHEIRPDTERNEKKRTPRRTEKLTTPDHIIQHNIKQRTNNNLTPINTGHTKNRIFNDVARHSLKKYGNKDSDPVNDATKQKKELKKYDNAAKANNHKEGVKEDSNSPRGSKNSPSSQNSSKANKINTDKTSTTKSEKSAKSKRSKYVINYDDKNGTVSSICKIKSGPGTYKRKLITIDNKDAQDSNTNNNKSLNKIALRK